MERIEFNKKDRVLNFSKKLKSNETYRINRGTNFFSVSVFKKPKKVVGFSNACEDIRYIPVWDYDNVYLDIVEEDFRFLQGRYNLPNAYVFFTKKEEDEVGVKGNFHVVCLKKFYYEIVKHIIGESRCDPNYKSMNTRTPYRSWVLRISPKGKRSRPQFLKIIGTSEHRDEEISKPHLELLEKIYPEIPNIKYSNKDSLKKVNIQEYETLNV